MYHGYGEYTSSDYTHNGEYNLDKQCGEGVMHFADGTMYTGNFDNDQYSGHGKLTSSTCVYTGRFKLGQKHGIGTEVHTNGEVYDGSFVNGLYHHQGTHTGPTFEDVGAYKYGNKHGHGVLTLTGVSKYTGTFVDNKPNGRGEIVCLDYKYVGRMKDGKKHRHGKLIRNDGISYTGNFLADAPHGMLEFVYNNNMRRTAEYLFGNHVGTDIWTELDDATYTGRYNNLIDWDRDGYGERTETNGDIYKGYWKANRRYGVGDYNCKEYHYVGEYKDDKRHGQGTVFYSADKSVYTGQFVHDRCEGYGKQTCTAYTYTGNFRQGKFDGYGELLTADGLEYVGTWINGKTQIVSLRTARFLDTQQDTNITQDDSSSGGISSPHTEKPKL
jgi:hypothetical protein